MNSNDCIKLLKKHRLYSAWSRNLLADGESVGAFKKDFDKTERPFSGFLSRAFLWTETPEGFTFWRMVADKDWKGLHK